MFGMVHGNELIDQPSQAGVMWPSKNDVAVFERGSHLPEKSPHRPASEPATLEVIVFLSGSNGIAAYDPAVLCMVRFLLGDVMLLSWDSAC